MPAAARTSGLPARPPPPSLPYDVTAALVAELGSGTVAADDRRRGMSPAAAAVLELEDVRQVFAKVVSAGPSSAVLPAGMWRRNSERPPYPGLPTHRAWQRRRADALRPLLDVVLDEAGQHPWLPGVSAV